MSHYRSPGWSRYSTRVQRPHAERPGMAAPRWLVMATNQMALPDGESEIMTQAEAYTMAGITRATFRGCIDRGELRIADHKGSRGAARVYRTDVLRLMGEKGWPGAASTGVPAQLASGDGCGQRECAGLREARRRDAETIRRLRSALAAATE